MGGGLTSSSDFGNELRQQAVHIAVVSLKKDYV